MIERIKRNFYNSVLRQRGSNIPRKITNLNDAKSIGICYDSTHPDHDIAITKFAELLRSKGKSVDIIAFLNDKKIDHKGDITIFNAAKVNWYGIPNDERVDAFISKKFDLLLCPLTNPCAPVEYISYLSNAKYRVGPYDNGKEDYFDLMIQSGEKDTVNYILQQMLHFLNTITY